MQYFMGDFLEHFSQRDQTQKKKREKKRENIEAKKKNQNRVE